MELWSVVFQTVESVCSMLGAVASLVLVIKQDRDDADDQDRRR